MTMPSFASLLQGFFTDRLMQQRQASPHTIASYRDSFRLLLQFPQKRIGVAPQKLSLEQIDAPLIAAFLEDMQIRRGVCAGSRNLRLTAIRSFFRYASFEMPTHGAQIQRVLAIPNKRCTRAQIGFLTREETDALLGAPDLSKRSGRRDHPLILLAVQTGLRLSEFTGLCRRNICLATGAHVRVIGKGRKERSTPLTKSTADVLRSWMREIEAHDDTGQLGRLAQRNSTSHRRSAQSGGPAAPTLGQLLGSYRAKAVPGHLQLAGVVEEEGVADLEAHGHTVDPTASSNCAQRGTAYLFKVLAKFSEASGSGDRIGRLACMFSLGVGRGGRSDRGHCPCSKKRDLHSQSVRQGVGALYGRHSAYLVSYSGNTHLSAIHLLSVLTLITVPMGICFIRRERVQAHRITMYSTFAGLIIAGAFTFLPHRILGQLLFGAK